MNKMVKIDDELWYGTITGAELRRSFGQIVRTWDAGSCGDDEIRLYFNIGKITTDTSHDTQFFGKPITLTTWTRNRIDLVENNGKEYRITIKTRHLITDRYYQQMPELKIFNVPTLEQQPYTREEYASLSLVESSMWYEWCRDEHPDYATYILPEKGDLLVFSEVTFDEDLDHDKFFNYK